MQLALFAVVLILSALQNGALLSKIDTPDCVTLIIKGGMTECVRAGYDSFETYDPRSCNLVCDENPRKTLPLPNGVCSGGKVKCTDQVRKILLGWSEDIEERKNKIKRKWCGSQGN